MKAYLEKLLKIEPDENAHLYEAGYSFLIFYMDSKFLFYSHGEEKTLNISNKKLDKKDFIFGEKLGYVVPNDNQRKWKTLTFYELDFFSKKLKDKSDKAGYSIFNAYNIILNEYRYIPILRISDAILLKHGGPLVTNILLKDPAYREAVKSFLNNVINSKQEDFVAEEIFDEALLKKYFPDRV